MNYVIQAFAGIGIFVVAGGLLWWLWQLTQVALEARYPKIGQRVLQGYLSQLFQWGMLCRDDPITKQLFRDLHGGGRFQSLWDFQCSVAQAFDKRKKTVDQKIKDEAAAATQTANLRVRADENLAAIACGIAGKLFDVGLPFTDYLDRLRFAMQAAEVFTQAEQLVEAGDGYDWYEATEHYTEDLLAKLDRSCVRGAAHPTTWELKKLAEEAVWHGLEKAAPDIELTEADYPAPEQPNH